MLNHDKVLNVCLFIEKSDGWLYCVDIVTEELTPVCKTCNVDKEYLNLFISSGVMYQTLFQQLQIVNTMYAHATMNNAGEIILTLSAMKQMLELALRAAVEGVKEVGMEVQEGHKTRKNVN
jgi:hypothetical protein